MITFWNPLPAPGPYCGDSGYRAGAMCDAVEINSGLVGICGKILTVSGVQCGDFMEWQPVQYYSRVIMNPPFSHGQDIRHILRAFPCCVRVACWSPSVSTDHASRRSCYRFLTSARAAARHVCLYRCPDDDYSSACLMTQGWREDKCPSVRAGKTARRWR